MTPAPTSSDLDVVQRAASQVGLNSADARLLRNGTNAVYLLSKAGVVVRVGRPGPHERRSAR